MGAGLIPGSVADCREECAPIAGLTEVNRQNDLMRPWNDLDRRVSGEPEGGNGPDGGAAWGEIS